MIREHERNTLHDLLQSRRSALVHGEPGVGKSWLVRDVCTSVGDQWHIEQFTGTAAGTDLTFCASAHLLPASPVTAEPFLVASVISALEERCGSKQLLLVVDDLNRIDPGTTAVIHQLASRGTVVLATARTAELAEPAVEPMWKDGWAELVHIDNVPQSDYGSLVTSVLGPSTPQLDAELWRLSDGNPLATLELLRGAHASSVLVSTDRGWELNGALPVPRAATERISERRDAYDESTRRALDIVGIAEPINRTLAAQWGIAAALPQLERDGLTISEEVPNGVVVRCAHPLLGDAVRAAVSALRRADLCGELVTAVDLSDPALGRLDVLRLARFALDGDIDIPLDVRVEAAGEALGTFDLALATRLIESIEAADRSFVAHMLAGRCHVFSGDFGEAETSFVAAENVAENEVEAAVAIAARAEMLIFMAGDPVTARSLLTDALESTTSAAARGELAAPLALAAGVTGDFGPALTLGDELLESAELLPATELSLLVVNTLAQGMAGPSSTARGRVARGLALAPDLRGVNPVAETQLGLNAMFLDLAELDGTAAIARGRASLAAAQAAGHPTAEWRMLLAIHLAYAGALEEALTLADEGVAEVKTFDPFGLYAMVTSVYAWLRAISGDTESAAAGLHHADEQPSINEARARVWRDRAEAALTAHHDLEAAAAQALEGASRAVAGHLHTWGSMVAHDATAYGANAAPALDAINAHANDSALTQCLADHAHARADHDLSGIDLAAERLTTGGLLVAGLEAAIAAISHEPDQAAMARRALAVHLQADGLPGPLPSAIVLPAHPLSEREFAVALAATTGNTSKAIADDLFVSTRTVDNHLGRIYQKLGIKSRAELTQVLSSS